MLSPLCRASTSNAAKAELLKSSKTQLTPVIIFSVYCHLASASGAWWQKLRDWGGASSLRPSGSLTQTQFHKHLQDSFIDCKTFTTLHHPYCCYMYIPGTTRLHIPLAHPCSYYYLLSLSILFLHILFVLHFFYSIANCTLYFSFFFTYIYIYALVLCYFYLTFIFFCTVHWADLTWFTFHFWLYPV